MKVKILIVVLFVFVCSMVFGSEDTFVPSDQISPVAILPFVNYTKTEHVEDYLSEMFSGELIRQTEYDVFHPTKIQETLEYYDVFKEDISIVEKAVNLARYLGAEYALYGIVTEYDGYKPYSLGLSIVMLDSQSGNVLKSKDILVDFSARSFKKKFGGQPRTMSEFSRLVIKQLVHSMFNPLAVEYEEKNIKKWRKLLPPFLR